MSTGDDYPISRRDLAKAVGATAGLSALGIGILGAEEVREYLSGDKQPPATTEEPGEKRKPEETETGGSGGTPRSDDMEQVRDILSDQGDEDIKDFRTFLDQNQVNPDSLPEQTEVYIIEDSTYLGHQDWGKEQITSDGLELDRSNGYSESEITELKDMLGLTTYSG